MAPIPPTVLASSFKGGNQLSAVEHGLMFVIDVTSAARYIRTSIVVLVLRPSPRVHCFIMVKNLEKLEKNLGKT